MPSDNSKAIPWLAVKKGYLLGIKPKALAAKYGTTAKAITVKASAEGWMKLKQTKLDKIPQEAESELEQMISTSFRINKQLLALLERNISTLSVTMGEKESINPLILNAQKETLKAGLKPAMTAPTVTPEAATYFANMAMGTAAKDWEGYAISHPVQPEATPGDELVDPDEPGMA